jgi:hypothetical protein
MTFSTFNVQSYKKSTRDQGRFGSVVEFLERIEENSIDRIFEVSRRVTTATTEPITEYVVLFSDYSYFCTCALLQNKGIVCRHFLWMLQERPEFVYHPALIPTRWYREDLQLDSDIRRRVQQERFVQADTHGGNVSVNTTQPSETFMNPLRQIYQAQPVIPPKQLEKTLKKRRSKIMGKVKKAVESMPQWTEEQFNTFKRCIDDSIRMVEGGTSLTSDSSNELLQGIRPEDVNDRDYPQKPGRGKASRILSSFERNRKKRPIGAVSTDKALSRSEPSSPLARKDTSTSEAMAGGSEDDDSDSDNHPKKRCKPSKSPGNTPSSRRDTAGEKHQKKRPNPTQAQPAPTPHALPRSRTRTSSASDDTAARSDDVDGENHPKKTRPNPTQSQPAPAPARLTRSRTSTSSASGDTTGRSDDVDGEDHPKKKRRIPAQSQPAPAPARLRRSRTSITSAKDDAAGGSKENDDKNHLKRKRLNEPQAPAMPVNNDDGGRSKRVRHPPRQFSPQ